MTEPLGSVRSLPFRIERADGIGELVIDQPPVNALIHVEPGTAGIL